MFPRILFFAFTTLAYVGNHATAMPTQMGMPLEPNVTSKGLGGDHQHPLFVSQNRTAASFSSHHPAYSQGTTSKNATHKQDIEGKGMKSPHKDTDGKKNGLDQQAVSSPLQAQAALQSASSTSPFMFIPRTKFCAQPDANNKTLNSINANITKSYRKNLVDMNKKGSPLELIVNQTKQVEVVFHVISDGENGNLSTAAINGQINELNTAYAAFGFSFNLSKVTRTNNATWYSGVTSGNNLQTEMKSALYQGNATVLNLYTVDFSDDLLGYSTFPFDGSAGTSDDGVVFLYSSVPGGSEDGYNEGKTAVHEVGHWLGLLHVFQGGCAAPGDSVSDTPPQLTATSGCPSKQDSCVGGGVDSIHNYMDYSSDPCMNQFTEGQAVRMAALTSHYRNI